MQLYVLKFLPAMADCYWFLPDFSTVLVKILFAMAKKPNPGSQDSQLE